MPSPRFPIPQGTLDMLLLQILSLEQSETGREAKFYSLTQAGGRQLAVEKDSWARLSGGVNLIFTQGSR